MAIHRVDKRRYGMESIGGVAELHRVGKERKGQEMLRYGTGLSRKGKERRRSVPNCGGFEKPCDGVVWRCIEWKNQEGE